MHTHQNATIKAVAVLLVTTMASCALAATGKDIPLWPDGAPLAKGTDAKDIPTLTVCLPSQDKATGCGIVICPGGGYGHLAMDHEGYQVAEWLNKVGVAGFILSYRHKARGYQHPAPLLDVQRAIRLVRARAKEWQVDPKRIGVLGFSAGGHLASSAGTHFDAGKTDAADAVDRVSCRPDFMVLVYPVITFTQPFMHRGSRRNLLGPNPTTDLIRLMSNELQVTKDTPPTFLVHGNDDKAVPPENSVAFYQALRKANVPAELHIYLHGKHGFGMRNPNDPVASWTRRCEAWLRDLGMLAR